jgi:hypothetical protein
MREDEDRTLLHLDEDIGREQERGMEEGCLAPVGMRGAEARQRH